MKKYRKYLLSLIIGISISFFAFQVAESVEAFDGSPCSLYCAQQVGDDCSDGCDISYSATGSVNSVNCKYKKCPTSDGETRPRIVEEGGN